MDSFIVVFHTAAYGAAFALLVCSRANRNKHRPGCHFAWNRTGVTGLTVMLLPGQADFFHPEQWEPYKGEFWLTVLFPTAIPLILL
jgi:hypothetical protein